MCSLLGPTVSDVLGFMLAMKTGREFYLDHERAGDLNLKDNKALVERL